MADYRLMGTSQAPKDLRAKVTGRSKYAEDFRADGMLFAKLLLSPVPHGRVVGFDASRALAMEGVLAVIRADSFGVGRNDLRHGARADRRSTVPGTTNRRSCRDRRNVGCGSRSRDRHRDRAAPLRVGSVGCASARWAESASGRQCV